MRATLANLSETPRRLGFINTIGLFTYGPGCLARSLGSILILLAILAGLRDLWIEKTAFRKAKTIKGTVTGTDYTSWTFGDREQQVIGFRFDLDGQPFEGYSYTLSGSWRLGQEVDIEYSPANPGISRIAGLGYSQLRFLVYIPLILALLFAIPAISGTVKAYRWGRLLERGAVAEAELLDRESLRGKKPTEAPNLKFRFSDASGGTHEIQTHNQTKLRAKGGKIVFYNPANPQRFLFLDQAPMKLKLAAPGKWAPTEQKGQILVWFMISFGLLFWALYLIVNLWR